MNAGAGTPGRPAAGRQRRRPTDRRKTGASGRGGRASARQVAYETLCRVELDGAYANLALPAALEASGLPARDRAFATELVYGTVRRARACDFLVDRFLLRDVEPEVRVALRMGAYQLAFAHVAPHAAVGDTVEVVPSRAKGLVNAVLRRVAARPVDDDAPAGSGGWPDLGTRLSYPDWMVSRLVADLGRDTAVAALEAMNQPAETHERADGYVQDLASQWVVELAGVEAGDRVLDLCAAPGGKATGMAEAGAWVAAVDVRPGRAELIRANAERVGASRSVATVVADGRLAPFAAATFDRVLVDAPCSGIGSLRRRPDARWRIDADAVSRLVPLQRELAAAAARLVRPGGVLVVSVCTLLDAETVELDAWLADNEPGLVPIEAPGAPWGPAGRGARLLPQAAGSDGMALFRYRRDPDR